MLRKLEGTLRQKEKLADGAPPAGGRNPVPPQPAAPRATQPAAPLCPAVPPSLQLHVVAGLHLIDFEQLKIENQTLNEKIEERNEELLKLRKKTTTTVQVLTHLKEKLQFVQAENQVLKHDLADLEIELTNKRDVRRAPRP